MRFWFAFFAVASVAVAMSVPSPAQLATAEMGQQWPVPKVFSECDDGLVYDDDSFENGYGSSSLFFAKAAMEVNAPAGSVMKKACVCWRSIGPDSSINFDIGIWAADGSGGEPGTFLGSLENAQATGVTTGPRFYSYDLSSLGIVLPGTVYVGVFWDPDSDEDFYVCADENGSSNQRAFFSSGIMTPEEPPTTEIGRVGFFPNYRALGIRVTVEDAAPPPPPPPPIGDDCEGRAAVLTLHDRFEISGEAQLQGNPAPFYLQNICSPEGVSPTALAFYFNAARDPRQEGFISITDNCDSSAETFKVEVASASTRRFVITVEDTWTGTVLEFDHATRGFPPYFPVDRDTFAPSCLVTSPP